MKLAAPFIQLPLSFDATRLAAEIDRLDPSRWRPHPQGFAGNSMLPLVAVDGDPANEAFAGPMAPTPELRACPYLTEVFAATRAVIGRSRLMRLSGQAEVTRHVDQGYYWGERVRIHVPVVTQPTVRFECGDQVLNMAAGDCWIFDTWRQHRVVNDAEQERIHLVIDSVGSGAFWDLVDGGRAYGADVPGWATRRCEPGSGTIAFACERRNVPTVMSPWEMATHFDLLFRDAAPHPSLSRLRAVVDRFLRTWQGLWFEFGDTTDAVQCYQPAIKQFIEDARSASQGVVLTNEIRWFHAVMTLVVRFAAGDQSAGARVGA